MGRRHNDLNALLRRQQIQGMLSGFLLLFQFTMGIAFTSGLLVFLTGGTSVSLRPLSSYNAFEVARFGIFLVSAIAFVIESSNSMQVRTTFTEYGYSMFRARVSFIFRILIALVYVGMSLTLSVSADPLAFFFAYGVMLAISFIWGIALLLSPSGYFRLDKAWNLFAASTNILVLGPGIYIHYKSH